MKKDVVTLQGLKDFRRLFNCVIEPSPCDVENCKNSAMYRVYNHWSTTAAEGYKVCPTCAEELKK